MQPQVEARPVVRRRSSRRNTGALVGLAAFLLVMAFALSAFWPSSSPPRGVVEPTPASATTDPRASQGRTLAGTFGCVACHSADGTRSVGPSWRGLYGSEAQLDDGQTIQVDAAYIADKIRNPDQVTVAGYPKGVMSASIQSFQSQLARRDTLDALVAYIQSLQ